MVSMQGCAGTRVQREECRMPHTHQELAHFMVALRGSPHERGPASHLGLKNLTIRHNANHHKPHTYHPPPNTTHLPHTTYFEKGDSTQCPHDEPTQQAVLRARLPASSAGLSPRTVCGARPTIAWQHSRWLYCAARMSGVDPVALQGRTPCTRHQPARACTGRPVETRCR